MTRTKSDDLLDLVTRMAVGLPMTPYACTAAMRAGARCRKLVPCPDHPGGKPEALRPDVVLIKVNLNRSWNSRFEEAGIQLQNRSLQRAEELSQEHQERARKLGRDSRVIRKKREDGQGETPESHDSGCPVFGTEGLKQVQGISIADVLNELEATGLRLINAHRLARNWKPPIRLVMVFSRDGTSVDFPRELFQEFVGTCFGRVDIWANDPDQRGNVVHTVNCGARNNEIPMHSLLYAGGDWEATLA